LFPWVVAGNRYLAAANGQGKEFYGPVAQGVEVVVELTVEPAYVTGRVLDEAGVPVRDARLELDYEVTSAWGTHLVASRGTTTDDRGRFQCPVLGVDPEATLAMLTIFVRGIGSGGGTQNRELVPGPNDLGDVVLR
jgi:hypothetical protein